MKEFPSEDHVKSIEDFEFSADNPPMQCNLDISGNILTDTFTVQVPNDNKAFTCRGVFSNINTII